MKRRNARNRVSLPRSAPHRAVGGISLPIQGYCALLALFLVILACGGRLTEQPGAATEPLVFGRFTRQQVLARSAALASRMAPDILAFRWNAIPHVAGSPEQASQRLWRVEGEEESGRRGVHFLFDATTGEMLQFSYSTGSGPPLVSAAMRMSRQETLRAARYWLRLYEEAHPSPATPPSALPQQWTAELDTSVPARSVVYRSENRTVRVTMHPATGNFVRLSCSPVTP
jgi:hypothetical protein